MNLRGHDSPIIIPVNTTKYGLHSVTYSASKLWNSLPIPSGLRPQFEALNPPLAVWTSAVTFVIRTVNYIF